MKSNGLCGLSILLLLLCAGCAPKPRGEEPLRAIDRAFETIPPERVKTAPPPPEISAALLPKAVMDAPDEQPFRESRFDIAADRVPAREFFLGLVKGTSDNMVVHPKVDGQISLSLKATSVSEVLEVISNVYGYPYVKTGSVYQVMPLGLQAKTFNVDYINLVRVGKSETRVSSGQVSQIKNEDSTKEEEVAGSRIETRSTADFWQELEKALQGIVGSKEGRAVVVQPQSSAVVVVAMPEELQTVEAYLQAIQQNLRRQVVIEARIVEVTLNDGFQSGVNWALLAAKHDNMSALVGQTGGGRVFDAGMPTSTDSSGGVGPGDTLPDTLKTMAFGGVFSLALDFNDFKAFIDLLQEQGDVQVLSSPRVSTMNNQKAVIKVGTDEFFLTDITSNTVTGTSTNNSVDITLTPFFSGIALDVTPQIDARGGVVMHIHPTVSEVKDQTKEISIFGGQNSGNQLLTLPLAKSTVRESDSVIRAESGQIVMIGGLMKDNQITQETGVPLLSKIPLIGGLFRHTKSVAQKSELVILLRPMVMTSQGDWRQLLGKSRQRIQ